MKRTRPKRAHWKEIVVRGAKLSVVPLARFPRTSKEMAGNLIILEELRRLCYPDLQKGLRMKRHIGSIKK